MINGIKVEVVINNRIDDAIAAARHDVDRFELVSAIELGGCTPNVGVLRLMKKQTKQEIVCMNRPRGGDFVYSEGEFEQMMMDAEDMIVNGADGIVFGFLNEDNTIDEAKTKKMIELIHRYNKEAIFHKASDMTSDIKKATRVLVNLGIDRIMSNGQAKADDLSDGCKVMKELAEEFGEKVQFLFGGGVREGNIKRVLDAAQAKQVHMTSKMTSEKGFTCLDEAQLERILNNLKQ